MNGPRVSDVIAALEAAYPPALAADWDAVGLVCGDPDVAVRRVLFAVDPTAAVVDDVLAAGAELLITHHPLFLTPVHGHVGIAAHQPDGVPALGEGGVVAGVERGEHLAQGHGHGRDCRSAGGSTRPLWGCSSRFRTPAGLRKREEHPWSKGKAAATPLTRRGSLR